jgi:tetratricopeptide (TPR) repeat protein
MSRSRPLSLALLLGLCLLPGGAAWAAPAVHTYLILPFEDPAPDGSRDWLQEAMALTLADYCVGAGQKVVSREDRLAAMDELDLPAGAPLTLATSLRLGKRLRSEGDTAVPDRLIVGKFSLDNGQLSMSARVLRLDANAAQPWREESGSLKDLLKLQKSLAHGLLKSDSVPVANLASHADNSDAGGSFPLVAYESYIRGLIDPSPAKQVTYLRKAIQQSPGYPKASYQLARLLARLGKRPEAESVLKAIAGEPDPYVAEYYALWGNLDLDAGRLSEAEEKARRSLAARETSDVHVLLARIARAHADPARALEELQRAESLDPDNPDIVPARRQIQKEFPPRS